MKFFLIYQEKDSHGARDWWIDRFARVEVGGKFEIEGAQRPSEIYSPRPVEVNRGTTGREIQREREEGIGRETVDGLAALYLRETGHRDPTVFTGSIHIRGEGEKLARRSSSPLPFPPLPCLSCAHPVPFDYFSSNIQRNGDRFCVEFAESMEPTYLGGWYILARIEEVMNKESGGSVNGILARYRKRRAFEISVVSWRGNVENNWTINRTMFARIQVVVVVIIVVDKCELSRTRWKTFAFPRTRD